MSLGQGHIRYFDGPEAVPYPATRTPPGRATLRIVARDLRKRFKFDVGQDAVDLLNAANINVLNQLARLRIDWERLRRDGFRLIDHGSREHKIALDELRALVSSQIDWYITSPLPAWRWGAENINKWHYTFLQHGVTKDDLSIWINPKPISLMITATRTSTRASSATTRRTCSRPEIRMTGFPRHDRLLELGATPPRRREPCC